MTELTLTEAAERIGVPERQLHIWTWDKIVPQIEGSSVWHPRYDEVELTAWFKRAKERQ